MNDTEARHLSTCETEHSFPTCLLWARRGGRSDSSFFSHSNRINRRKRKRQIFVGEPMKEKQGFIVLRHVPDTFPLWLMENSLSCT